MAIDPTLEGEGGLGKGLCRKWMRKTKREERQSLTSEEYLFYTTWCRDRRSGDNRRTVKAYMIH